MLRIIIVFLCIFVSAVLMSMVGRGGGNFYVPILIAAGASMNTAAISTQLILMTTALVATLVFHKYKIVDWKLALVIDPSYRYNGFCWRIFCSLFCRILFKITFCRSFSISSLFYAKTG